MPAPSWRAIARQEAPWARSSATLSASTGFRGRPIRTPRARAAAMPDRTRSRMLALGFGDAGEDAEHGGTHVRVRAGDSVKPRNAAR